MSGLVPFPWNLNQLKHFSSEYPLTKSINPSWVVSVSLPHALWGEENELSIFLTVCHLQHHVYGYPPVHHVLSGGSSGRFKSTTTIPDQFINRASLC